jgi:hypothetical protein
MSYHECFAISITVDPLTDHLVMFRCHPTKITFAEMRDMGVRGLLIYCADYRCSHSIAISGDAWPDDARLSDIEERFTCRVCGKRGADVRPDFTSAKPARQ